jgi:hypothetical protein
MFLMKLPGHFNRRSESRGREFTRGRKLSIEHSLSSYETILNLSDTGARISIRVRCILPPIISLTFLYTDRFYPKGTAACCGGNSVNISESSSFVPEIHPCPPQKSPVCSRSMYLNVFSNQGMTQK